MTSAVTEEAVSEGAEHGTYVVKDAPEHLETDAGKFAGFVAALRERMVDEDRPSWLARIGLPLITLGTCAILFVLYVYTFTGFQEQRAQREMLNSFTSPAGAVPLSGKVPNDGTPTAVIRIPSLGLHQVVIQGTTATELTKGPGVLTQAARPGTIGNAVILGRRATSGAPFASIETLKRGARISLTTGLGHFNYKVVAVKHAKPGQLSPASPHSGRWLTLITADSSVKPAGLVYARSKLMTAPAASTRAKTAPSKAELGLVGDPAALTPSLVWGIILALVLSLTFAAYRRLHRQLITVYLLTTPIVLAVALVLFSNLYRLLPATL
ncbi:MAG: sortase [Actinobacteria bacterium]|nr:sortase [Actinomycetota bacterium]